MQAFQEPKCVINVNLVLNFIEKLDLKKACCLPTNLNTFPVILLSEVVVIEIKALSDFYFC